MTAAKSGKYPEPLPRGVDSLDRISAAQADATAERMAQPPHTFETARAVVSSKAGRKLQKIQDEIELSWARWRRDQTEQEQANECVRREELRSIEKRRTHLTTQLLRVVGCLIWIALLAIVAALASLVVGISEALEGVATPYRISGTAGLVSGSIAVTVTLIVHVRRLVKFVMRRRKR